jgi:hypothetical protein
MILLTATTHIIELETSGTASTDYVVSYVDVTAATEAISLGSGQGTISSATTTTIVAAPGSGVARQIKHISVANRDGSATQTVTFKKDVSGTEYDIFVATLRAGECVEYVDGRGFRHFSPNGIELVSSSNLVAVPSVLIPPHFTSANLTSVRTTTSAIAYAVYMGKAPRSLTTVRLRLRVTTAAATITWCEAAIATGTVNVGGNPTLTVRGYADTSGSWNSTGLKTNDVSVSSGQVINEGDDLWAIYGASATTVLVVRAVSIADDLQVGLQASLSNRPSTNVGTAQAYTVESATTTAAWIAAII